MAVKTVFLLLIAISSTTVGTSKPNVVLFYIESINEVAKVLHLIDENIISRDALPNIYKLREDSVSFHNIYGELSSSSNFAALFTGKAAVDIGMIRGKLLPFDYFPSLASTGGLGTDEVTVAELLRSCSYKTWFIGYWKLGLGEKGNRFPTEHGFDTWLGTAHPHDEWCHRQDSNKSSPRPDWTHPYTNLFYKASFLWMIVVVFLTSLVWFRLITFRLFINLLIYTFCTSLAFYLLLNLFMVQRSASCVLYYHNTILQQPYELDNLTMLFTQHSSELLEVGGVTPFFMVLNYMKMNTPLFHSNFFRTKSMDMRNSALLELDWSIGEIISKLKKKNLYNNSIILLTGSKNQQKRFSGQIEIYERYSKKNFRTIEVLEDTLWSNRLKIPLFIKQPSISDSAQGKVFQAAPVTDIFDTILHMTSCHFNNRTHNSLFTSNEKNMAAIPESNSESFDLLETHDKNVFSESSAQDGSYTQLMKLVTESEEDDVTVEAYVEDDFSDNSVSSHFKEGTVMPARVLFHYFNVEKPVAVTYQGRYQLMYSYLDASGNIRKLSTPLLVDLHRSVHHVHNCSSEECPNWLNREDAGVFYEEVYHNITQLYEHHLAERQNRKMWSSEFEMPVYPWLLPCQDFPYCETLPSHDDFSDITRSITDN